MLGAQSSRRNTVDCGVGQGGGAGGHPPVYTSSCPQLGPTRSFTGSDTDSRHAPAAPSMTRRMRAAAAGRAASSTSNTSSSCTWGAAQQGGYDDVRHNSSSHLSSRLEVMYPPVLLTGRW